MDRWHSIRNVECVACGAFWPRRTARFCGGCGAVLSVASDEGPGFEVVRSGRGPGGPILRAVVAAGVVVVLVLAAVVAATVARSPGIEEPPESSAEVVLPDREAIGPDEQAAPPAAAELASDPDPTCTGGVCETWRRELPPGPVHPVGGWFIHVHTEVGPPTDWPDETREEPSRAFATLTAISPGTGEVGWQQELRLPHLTNAPIRVAEIDDDLLIVTWDSKVTALGADGGERRWSQRVANEAARVHPGAAGEVVVWHRATVGLGLQELRGPLTGGLTRLDRATGEPQGTLRPARLVAFLDDQAILQSSDDQTIAGVGLDDLMPRWERGSTLLRDRPPIPQADGSLALLTDRSIELLDPSSGETLAARPLEIASHEVIEVVGTTAIRYRPDGPPGLLNAGLTVPSRSSVELYDLTDPERTPSQIDDVIGVQPVRTPPGGASVPEDEWPVDRVVIVSQEGRSIGLTVLDGNASDQHEIDLGTATCCWSLLPTRDPEALALLSPDDHHRIAVVDIDEGYATELGVEPGLTVTEVAASPVAPERSGAATPLIDRLTLATDDDSVPGSLVLVSRSWRFESPRPAELIATDAAPAVRTSDELIGLHPG